MLDSTKASTPKIQQSKALELKRKIEMKFLVTLLLLCVSSICLSAEHTPEEVPRNIHVIDTVGNTYVDLVADTCSGSRYYISPGHSKYDTIISILLAAQVSGNEVVLRYDGCNGQNQGKVVGVYLK